MIRSLLEKGAKAPFSGVLISKDALAKLMTSHTAALKTLRAELVKKDAEHKLRTKTMSLESSARLDAAAGKLKVCKDTNKISRSIYDLAMKRTVKSCQRNWYEHPLIVFASGVAVCSASVGIGLSFR